MKEKGTSQDLRESTTMMRVQVYNWVFMLACCELRTRGTITNISYGEHALAKYSCPIKNVVVGYPILLKALSEQSSAHVVVWFFLKIQISGILKEPLKAWGQAFAYLGRTEALLELANLVVLLFCAVRLQALPGETRHRQIHEHVTQRFQVIASAQLQAKMRTYRTVACCANQVGDALLSLRNMLPCHWIHVNLGEAKVNNVHHFAVFACSHQEVVGLHVTMHYTFLMHRLHTNIDSVRISCQQRSIHVRFQHASLRAAPCCSDIVACCMGELSFGIMVKVYALDKYILQRAVTCTRARSWSASISTVLRVKRRAQTSKRSSKLLPTAGKTWSAVGKIKRDTPVLFNACMQEHDCEYPTKLNLHKNKLSFPSLHGLAQNDKIKRSNEDDVVTCVCTLTHMHDQRYTSEYMCVCACAWGPRRILMWAFLPMCLCVCVHPHSYSRRSMTSILLVSSSPVPRSFGKPCTHMLSRVILW